MKGAIIGDIIGSRFEWKNLKSKEFDLFTEESCFTDDTVLTIAIADGILCKGRYAYWVKYYGNLYPKAGYGGTFIRWLSGEIDGPYNSWGNGSAMRVSPVGYAYNDELEILKHAKRSAEITHNHPEGIKGAMAVAMAVYLARTGSTKEEIKQYITQTFGYDLDRRIDDIRPEYTFDVSCQGSVPESIIAFLESTDFEDAIRTAISIGGDSDTIACIAGAIAEAYYQHIPPEIEAEAWKRLPLAFREIVKTFEDKYCL